MPFGSDVILAILSSKSLQLYSKKKGFIAELELNDKGIAYLEVRNPGLYESSLRAFFELHQIKRADVVILLKDDLLFKKAFSSIAAGDYSQYVNEFLDSVPFKKADLASVVIKDAENTNVYAVNNRIFRVLAETLMQYKCNVLGVSAETIIGTEIPLTPGPVDKDVLEKSFAKLASVRGCSFTENKKCNLPHRKKVIILSATLASFITILFIVGFLLIYSNRNAKPQNAEPTGTGFIQTEEPATEPTVTESTSSTGVTESDYKPKEQLTIVINNGSRIPGQAAQVKALLSPLGYSSITTGNLDYLNPGPTTVQFSSVTADGDREAIISVLDGLFTDVSESSESSSDFDVVINTSR